MAPEPPGPQQCQPLAECPLRNRLVNAQVPAARQQAAPATVAEAVTAVSHDGHISFLLRVIVTALGVLAAGTRSARTRTISLGIGQIAADKAAEQPTWKTPVAVIDRS